MENIVVRRAKEFLENVSDGDLNELVFSATREIIPSDHIIRNLVKYAYQGINIPFSMGMTALYPLIAQEAYRRFVNASIKQYQNN